VWRDNVLALCERAGLELDADDLSELDRWLLAGLQSESGEPVVQSRQLAD
jgi:hypothetical protein